MSDYTLGFGPSGRYGIECDDCGYVKTVPFDEEHAIHTATGELSNSTIWALAYIKEYLKIKVRKECYCTT